MSQTWRVGGPRLLPCLCLAAMLVARTSAQQKVNIMVLRDEGNMQADQGIKAAIAYLGKNTGEGVTVDGVDTMEIKKGGDIEATINATCDLMDKAIDAGKPPHIVLDVTTTGIMAETAKMFTRALALPTFSASYGQDGDIRCCCGCRLVG
ncbi:hypothetical protein OTU49_006844 [Cherax quadricarinatus]|uniref:Uncharacterized protein n=1 Tax=Cherax quadricarinatus TaxID=27406 RepID=A0AAW0WYW5_CHEQU